MTAAWTTLDELDTGSAFRKIRPALGITAFGANAIVFPEGAGGFWHYHDIQDELYFVHQGTALFEIGDASQYEMESVTLSAGGLVHVPSTVHRRVSNAGEGDLVVIVVGGKDGYVNRDGQLVDINDLEARRRISSSTALENEDN